MKAGSAKGRKAPKSGEKELVIESLSEATGARFEVVAPHPAFPLPVENLEWFMRCRNKEEIAKTPYLNVVWKEKGGGIWLESLAVGDTIDWIELAYGDALAGESLDIDYSRFGDSSFREEFSRKFPLVMARIGQYEEAAMGIAKRRRVHLEIRRAGSKGMLVFTIAARVGAWRRGSLGSLRAAIKKNVSAMKDAYEAIASLRG